MLHRLRLAHRLLLIYLLSFLAVAVLAYGLIAEKNIAIDFALKELRGNAYVAVPTTGAGSGSMLRLAAKLR